MLIMRDLNSDLIRMYANTDLRMYGKAAETNEQVHAYECDKAPNTSSKIIRDTD